MGNNQSEREYEEIRLKRRKKSLKKCVLPVALPLLRVRRRQTP